MSENSIEKSFSHPDISRKIYLFFSLIFLVTSQAKAQDRNQIKKMTEIIHGINTLSISKIDKTSTEFDSLLRDICVEILKEDEIKESFELNNQKIDSIDFFLQIIKTQFNNLDSLMTKIHKIPKEDPGKETNLNIKFSKFSSSFEDNKIFLSWYHFFDVAKNYPVIHEYWHSVDWAKIKEYSELRKTLFGDKNENSTIYAKLIDFLNKNNEYNYDPNEIKPKLDSLNQKITDLEDIIYITEPTDETMPDLLRLIIKYLLLLAQKKDLEEILRTYNSIKNDTRNIPDKEKATNKHSEEMAEYFLSEIEFLPFIMQFYYFLEKRYENVLSSSPEEVLKKIRSDQNTSDTDLYFRMFIDFDDNNLLEIISFASKITTIEHFEETKKE